MPPAFSNILAENAGTPDTTKPAAATPADSDTLSKNTHAPDPATPDLATSAISDTLSEIVVPPVAPSAPTPEPAAAAAASPPAVVTPAPRPLSRRQTSPPAEHTLIAAARAALKTGDLAAARTFLANHQRFAPRGLLAEEREVLLIRLAVASGLTAKAQHLINRFRATWPNSIYLPGLAPVAP